MSSSLAWLSRAAALMLLVLALGAAYYLGVGPMIADYRSNGEAIADAQALLERFRHVAGAEGDLRENLAELKKRQASQGYYLAKNTDALAAAALQEHVKGVVQESGGKIRSIQTLPGQDEGNFRRIAIRLQMTMTTESLSRAFYALETSKPFLFLDNVDVQSRLAQPAGAGVADPVLVVAVDLYGYRQQEAP
jgi:general secretion pathway protein M